MGIFQPAMLVYQREFSIAKKSQRRRKPPCSNGPLCRTTSSQSTEMTWWLNPNSSWRFPGCWNGGMCPFSLFTNLGGLWFCWVPQTHRRHRPCAVRSMLTWLQLRLYLPLNWVNPWPVAEVNEVTSSIRFEWMKPGAFGCEEKQCI